MPTGRELEALLLRIESLMQQMTSESLRLKKLHRLKTGLMQDLLTGKVPVKADEAEEIAP